MHDKCCIDRQMTNAVLIVSPNDRQMTNAEIDLVKHNPKPPHNQTPPDAATHTPPSTIPPDLILPEIYRSRAACIYNTDGKCVGMMPPHCFGVLYKAFHKAKAIGLHSSICPPPASFASEPMRLLARKTVLQNKYQRKRIKDSFSWTLPPYIHNAFQNRTYTIREKMASPLDYNTQYQH
eukprot:1160520-Pelagomonas_calceolata.AAC.2